MKEKKSDVQKALDEVAAAEAKVDADFKKGKNEKNDVHMKEETK